MSDPMFRMKQCPGGCGGNVFADHPIGEWLPCRTCEPIAHVKMFGAPVNDADENDGSVADA